MRGFEERVTHSVIQTTPVLASAYLGYALSFYKRGFYTVSTSNRVVLLGAADARRDFSTQEAAELQVTVTRHTV